MMRNLRDSTFYVKVDNIYLFIFSLLKADFFWFTAKTS